MSYVFFVCVYEDGSLSSACQRRWFLNVSPHPNLFNNYAIRTCFDPCLMSSVGVKQMQDLGFLSSRHLCPSGRNILQHCPMEWSVQQHPRLSGTKEAKRGNQCGGYPQFPRDLWTWAAAQEEETPEEERQGKGEGQEVIWWDVHWTPNSMTTDSWCLELNSNRQSLPWVSLSKKPHPQFSCAQLSGLLWADGLS